MEFSQSNGEKVIAERRLSSCRTDGRMACAVWPFILLAKGIFNVHGRVAAESRAKTVLAASGAIGLCDDDWFERRSVLQVHGSYLACH